MSKTTLTLLTSGDVWRTNIPKWFMVEFEKDDSIASIEFWSKTSLLDKLLNVVSGDTYRIYLKEPLHKIIFIPDDVFVEKQLRITNIQFDSTFSFTTSDEDKYPIYEEDGKLAYPLLTFDNIVFNNGIGTGFVGLAPDSIVDLMVVYKGAVIGYVVSNTSTTVVLDRLFTNLTPSKYSFYTRTGAMLLSMCSILLTTIPPNTKDARTSVVYYAAPPFEFEVVGATQELLSNVSSVSFGFTNYEKLGTPYETP